MFTMTEEAQSLILKFDSDPHQIDRAVRELRAFLASQHLVAVSEMVLVTRELLANAIEHGNHKDPKKVVHCTVSQVNDLLYRIEVADEGEGFDTSLVAKATMDDPGRERQRGYAIINAMTELVEFNEKGNVITAYVAVSRSTRFELNTEGGRVLVRPNGDITAAVADRLRVLLLEQYEAGYRCFHFDMARVQDMDSVSLSIFVVLAKMVCDEPGHELELANTSEDIQNLFRMTRLNERYTISGQREDA